VRVVLVNPPWTFEGSVYLGCREPQLPLELGYFRALLQARGHGPGAEIEACRGCVSIEAGVESITERGRGLLQKRCKLSTGELTELFVQAKHHVAFVQANPMGTADDADQITRWRGRFAENGVGSNQSVPFFPYPGSPEYRLRWGELDDTAWERAHADCLERQSAFSDLQSRAPQPLTELEGSLGSEGR
jgi:hypothetical protein